MAQFVVERHPDSTQARPASPRAIQGIAPGLEDILLLSSDHNWQGICDALNAFLCEEVDDGIGFLSVERLDGMGDSVQAGRDSHFGGQGKGKRDIVNDDFGKNFQGLLCRLLAVFCLADDRRCL